LNEGNEPPNTAALAINDGLIEKNLVLKSTMRSCGSLNIKVQ